MAFSSLADELGDVFGQDDAVLGGRSLADEFGLDFGVGDELVGDGSLDDVEDSLIASPPTPNPITPHLPSTPPTPTTILGRDKGTSPSMHSSDEMMENESPFHTPLRISRSVSPSNSNPRRSLHHHMLSPRPPPSTSRYTPVIERDPLVELEECMASTSRLIIGLKGLHSPASLGESSSSKTITSLGSRSISSFGSHGTIRGLRGDAGDGDVVDRLSGYVASMQKREKRLDERLKQLEGMMGRWEGVGYGIGLELDLRSLINGIGDETDQVVHGLPTPHPLLTSSSSAEIPLSPSLDLNDPFSPPPKTQYHGLGITSQTETVSHHLAEIHPDPLLPTLLILRETLHTHSSHALATQRQVRQMKGAIQGAKERDEAEEVARRGIEAWEARRVADGLKGEGGVAGRLEREMVGFGEVLGRFETDMRGKMEAARGVRT